MLRIWQTLHLIQFSQAREVLSLPYKEGGVDPALTLYDEFEFCFISKYRLSALYFFKCVLSVISRKNKNLTNVSQENIKTFIRFPWRNFRNSFLECKITCTHCRKSRKYRKVQSYAQTIPPRHNLYKKKSAVFPFRIFPMPFSPKVGLILSIHVIL